MKPPPSDRKALLARYDSLSEAGCSAWILDECNTYTEDPAKQRLQETRPCDLTGSCNTIGRRAKDAGQALAARDAYERGCQYDLSDSHRCYGIGTEYLDHRWPEPVPGRGQALIDWECMTWEKTLDKGESIVDMLPECKRMTPHQ
jgi:hypothetical protein